MYMYVCATATIYTVCSCSTSIGVKFDILLLDCNADSVYLQLMNVQFRPEHWRRLCK